MTFVGKKSPMLGPSYLNTVIAGREKDTKVFLLDRGHELIFFRRNTLGDNVANVLM